MPKPIKQAILRSASTQERPTEEETDLRERFLTLLREQFRIKQGQSQPNANFEDRTFPMLDADIEKWKQSALRELPYMPPAPGFRGTTLAPLSKTRKSASGSPYTRLMQMVPELQGIARNVSHTPLSLYSLTDTAALGIPPELVNLGGAYQRSGPSVSSIYLNAIFDPDNPWAQNELGEEPANVWRKQGNFKPSANPQAELPRYGTHVLGHEYGHAVGLPHNEELTDLERLLTKAFESRK